MASNLKLSTNARNALMNRLSTYLEALGHANLEVYTGSPPTNVYDDTSGTKLATMNFGNGWYAATNGVLQADDLTSGTAIASGDVGYFRIYRPTESGAGPAVCQGTCGESADTPDLVFNEKTIVIGCTVQNTGFTITCPA